MHRIFLLLFLFVVPKVFLSSQDFYDLNTISTIEITFAESNWDAILDTYYANDNDEKLMGSVVVNGEPYDSVGVKFKGNSTYDARNAKNPLHIYLDYVKNQDYDGYESIKLSNGQKDPSFVREVLSYQIARKYMSAPLSNYAKVYINGSYYGMFSSSEAINGDFADRRLESDNDNTRIKCNPENTSNGGSSLEYLGTDSSKYYSYYEMKSDAGWQDLIDLTYTLANESQNVESILDIDRAIWMMAFNNVLVNLDSYIGPFRQNYYLIKDNNGRFIPVIWDLNECLGGFESIDMGGGGGGRPPMAGSTTTSTSLPELDLFLRNGDSSYPLLQVILNNERYRKMYIAHCSTMLNENFANDWYYTEAKNLQSLISGDLASDPNAFYSTAQFTGNLTSTQDQTTGITELMKSRINYLQGLDVFNYTQPDISNIVTPNEIAPFTTISVTANIADANYAYLAYRHSKDEVFTKVEMFDDGNHNDGTAGDGVYAASFEVDESNTHYYIYAENSEAGIFSPARAEHEYYKITAEAKIEYSASVAINELMAGNDNVMQDAYGEYDDWVELYNNTSEDISLDGYFLTDDNEDVMKWAFPDTTIKANAYLMVWTDKDEEQGPMHTNFKLSSGGETVSLVQPDYTIVNMVTFGSQLNDYSFSRNPNGLGDFVIQGSTFAYNNEETSVSNEDLGFLLNTDKNEITLQMKTYPTLVQNILNINIATELSTGGNLYLVNSFGQIVEARQITGSGLFTIDMQPQPAGMYLVVFEYENKRYTSKIMKQ